MSKLPAWALPTAGSGFSSLLSLTANLASNGGSQPMEKRRAGGHGPALADQLEWEIPGALLPTAKAARNKTSGRQEGSKHHSGTTLSDVCWELTNLPSSDGKPSPAQPPTPSTSGDD